MAAKKTTSTKRPKAKTTKTAKKSTRAKTTNSRKPKTSTASKSKKLSQIKHNKTRPGKMSHVEISKLGAAAANPTKAEIAQCKADFVEIYRSKPISMSKAAALVGRAYRTINKWSNEDPEFKKALDAVKTEQLKMRVDQVKEAVFEQIIDGRAPAAVTIYWLKVQGGKIEPEWRTGDRKDLYVGPIGANIDDVEHLPDEQLEALAAEALDEE